MNWSEHNLESICKYSYNIFRIPVYLYESEKLISSIPTELMTYHPHEVLQNPNFVGNSISYYQTKDNFFWGSISIKDTEYKLLIGPISSLPLSDNQLSYLFYQMKVPAVKRKLIERIYKTIPLDTQLDFIDRLLFLQYIFNQDDITRNDFFRLQNDTLSDTSNQTYMKKQSFNEDSSSMLIEPDSIIMYIETGNIHSVMEYLCSPEAYTELPWGENSIMQHKQIGYYSIALFAEAARRGGIPLKECSEIVANYYSDITKLEDIEQIDFLIGRCALFFAEKVHSIPLPQNLDQSLLSSIHFIRQNVYSSLTVDDVAQQLGYSRSHTSKLFHEELGFTPGEFIIRTKLEESKILLAHSDKSLSEIASLLTFANQSHFQRSFKKHYNITPLQYRKKSLGTSIPNQYPQT